MKTVMRIVDVTGTVVDVNSDGRPGQYVVSYELDGQDGESHVTTCDDIDHAMRFETAEDAITAWQSVPKTKPIRSDGRPNKPLTAFTIELVPVDDNV